MKTLLVLACLLVSAPVHAADWRSISEAAAIVGHSADLASTEHCLGARTCHELNPWLARVDSPTGFAVAKMTVASLGLWATRQIPNKRLAVLVNVSIGVAFTVVAVRNRQQGLPR